MGVGGVAEREACFKNIFNEKIKEIFPNVEEELANNFQEGH